MTATEELRALLDERGVEWTDGGNALLWCTVWHGKDGKQWRMTENMSGMLTELKSWHVTPAQAIEATLGRGECRMLRISEACYDDIECSECGACLLDEYPYALIDEWVVSE